jgi:caffeoyl-CoA O-methyltransferase
MEVLNAAIENYVETNTSNESELLQRLNKQTHLEVLLPNMISGHVQGMFLKFISCMIQPMRILEIGTFTGYSTICLAEGLQKNGEIHTVECNVELKRFHNAYFKEAGILDRTVIHYGQALNILPNIYGTFDVVFIDADKDNYSNYYDLIIDKVRPGGFILADNVLWKGKVVQTEMDKKTKALDAFNKKVGADDRVENMILPLRDGIMMIRKR